MMKMKRRSVIGVVRFIAQNAAERRKSIIIAVAETLRNFKGSMNIKMTPPRVRIRVIAIIHNTAWELFPSLLESIAREKP